MINVAQVGSGKKVSFQFSFEAVQRCSGSCRCTGSAFQAAEVTIKSCSIKPSCAKVSAWVSPTWYFYEPDPDDDGFVRVLFEQLQLAK